MTDFTTTNGDDPTTTDPGIVGSEAEREAESERTEARRTTREGLGVNSNGDPELYPSDREALMTQYGVTAPEAESLFNRITNGEDGDTVADEIKSGRVYYRAAYEQVPADATVIPGAAATATGPTQEELDKQQAEQERLQEAANAPTTDTTQPEAGPYGPYADYSKKEKSPEEVSSTTGLSLEDAEKVLDAGGGGVETPTNTGEGVTTDTTTANQ